jgi:tripartite-type tricarboxylate transporter receptor subunit TctC
MVSGAKRNAAIPDVPSAAESGLPDYTVSTWYGLWAPKGTPADIQAHIVDEVRKAIQTDELKAIWAQQGADFPNLSQQQFGAFVGNEVKRWAAVVRASGAKLD